MSPISQLQIDCESDQETCDNRDQNCQICHPIMQLLLWNRSSKPIKVHTAAHWVLICSIHIDWIRSSNTSWEIITVSQAIWWKENIAVNHPTHLLEKQNQVQEHKARDKREIDLPNRITANSSIVSIYSCNRYLNWKLSWCNSIDYVDLQYFKSKGMGATETEIVSTIKIWELPP